MSEKELRVVRDAKFTGNFTREQIERAIRNVEGDQATGHQAGRQVRTTSRPRKPGAAASH
jgi:hypothetical protein